VGVLVGHVAAAKDQEQSYAELREQMVAQEIAAAGVTHPGVLQSMRSTARHAFVPAGFRKYSYFDAALPIGNEQTISPPFVVAYMTEQLDPQPEHRVLEIGTGSGYQAAVLSPLVDQVYTIEIVPQLGQRAGRTLKRLGYENIHVRVGDGFKGWPEQAPFDRIIVTCSPEKIPQPLVEQLAEGGQMIIPVGQRYQQNLIRVTKQGEELVRQTLRATLFVPMTGAAEDSREVLPDPARPRIVNGSFEQTITRDGQTDPIDLPANWHYMRQAQVVTAGEQARSGTRYLSLSNAEPGRACRALQGMALDGRRAALLRISASVRGHDIRPGPTPGQLPAVIITFYDNRRAAIDSQQLGPWEGTFDWRREESVVRVPLAAREAIVRLGLLGGTGQIDMDDLSLEVVEDP